MISGFFFFKQKTAYEMRISDWSSDVCSSDLRRQRRPYPAAARRRRLRHPVRGDGDVHPRLGGAARPRLLAPDRKSVVWGKSVSVRVDLGGRRIIKKKNK